MVISISTYGCSKGLYGSCMIFPFELLSVADGDCGD